MEGVVRAPTLLPVALPRCCSDFGPGHYGHLLLLPSSSYSSLSADHNRLPVLLAPGEEEQPLQHEAKPKVPHGQAFVSMYMAH